MTAKERTIKELLIILRDNLKKRFAADKENGGMCALVWDLERHNFMSLDERLRLFGYIYENKPKCASRRMIKYGEVSDRKGFSLGRHWWKPRVVKPRIAWLNKQIEML